jgi:predicted ABC-type transport system involved in lysophospholipase L1 biosynthesis ATPase subunit
MLQVGETGGGEMFRLFIQLVIAFLNTLNEHLRVSLTGENAHGAQTVARRRLRAKQVNLTFQNQR